MLSCKAKIDAATELGDVLSELVEILKENRLDSLESYGIRVERGSDG